MAWSDTSEGANLVTAYQQLQATWNTNMPNHKQSLWNLAKREIKG